MQIPTGNFGNAMPTVNPVNSVRDTGTGKVAAAIKQAGQQDQRMLKEDIQFNHQQQTKQFEEEYALNRQLEEQEQREVLASQVPAAQTHLAKLHHGAIDAIQNGATLEEAQKQITEGTNTYKKTLSETIQNPHHRQAILGQMDAYGQKQQYTLFKAHQKSAQKKIADAENETMNSFVSMSLEDREGADKGMENYVIAKYGRTDEAVKKLTEYNELSGQARFIRDGGDANSLESIDAMLERAKKDEYYFKDEATKQRGISSIKSKKRQIKRQIDAQQKKFVSQMKTAVDKVESTLVSGNPVSDREFDHLLSNATGSGLETRIRRLRDIRNKTEAFKTKTQAERKKEIDAMYNVVATGQASSQDIKWHDMMVKMDKQITNLTQNDPLTYIARVTQTDSAPPLDVNAVAQGGMDNVADALTYRAEVLKQYKQENPDIQIKPLYANEVEAVKQGFEKMGYQQQLSFLGGLSSSMPNESFRATIDQIADGDNTLVAAGVAAQNKLKTDDGKSVGELILKGAKIRKDGVKKLPSKAYLRGVFVEQVSDVINPDSQGFEQSFDLFTTLYAAQAYNDEKDEKLEKTVIKQTTGGIIKYNGVRIITPYGMDEDTFEQKAESAIRQAAPKGGYEYHNIDSLPLMRVVGAKDTYLISDGTGGWLQDGNGAPLTVEIK